MITEQDMALLNQRQRDEIHEQARAIFGPKVLVYPSIRIEGFIHVAKERHWLLAPFLGPSKLLFCGYYEECKEWLAEQGARRGRR